MKRELIYYFEKGILLLAFSSVHVISPSLQTGSRRPLLRPLEGLHIYDPLCT